MIRTMIHGRSPEQIEAGLTQALEDLQQQSGITACKKEQQLSVSSAASFSSTTVVAGSFLLFPTIRECNAALAAFGDAQEFLRALKFFGKMRKASRLAGSSMRKGVHRSVPTPTLVTYSTLMSRFLKANKAVVALRLWTLMLQSSPLPTSSESSVSPPVLEIDVKAANILMNCHAKMANVQAAQELLHEMKKTMLLPAKTVSSSSSATTVQQQQHGSLSSPHVVLQWPRPNSITYNTFLSACHKAGDLDAAVQAIADMTLVQKLRPDAQTYTSLIATVARKPSQTAGQDDPSPAFSFLSDMVNQHGIRPNGMTYSALIDVCGRCQRSDLALQGLRIMQSQKAQEIKELAVDNDSTASADSNFAPFSQSSLKSTATARSNQTTTSTATKTNYTLSGEVGAWTAAINACGKAGRLDTAVRLFFAMDETFGVQPNVVTCGSLTDSLLRMGRTADTLNVFRYMKRTGIRPSEVMYTSLMARAEQMVQLEQRQRDGMSQHQQWWSISNQKTAARDGVMTKAIEVYTELIDSLINVESTSVGGRRKDNSSTRNPAKLILPTDAKDTKSLALVKAFLVFQEMKRAGVEIDLFCYNTLLRACAQAGDVERAQEVLGRMMRDGLDPNDTSWRLLLRSASSVLSTGSSQSDKNSTMHLVVSVWKQGLAYQRQKNQRNRNSSLDEPASEKWIPSIDSFVTLLATFMRQAELEPPRLARKDNIGENSESDEDSQMHYRSILDLYNAILMGRSNMGMNRIDINCLLDSQRAMLLILQAIVKLESLIVDEIEVQLNGEMTKNNNGVSCVSSRKQAECLDLRSMATSILELDCFRDLLLVPSNGLPFDASSTTTAVASASIRLGPSARYALRTARSWI